MESRSPIPGRRSGATAASAALASDLSNNTVAVDVLGDHWKSALCVTSLYDSYVALQHENESLKEQLEHVQHANELLAVEARSLTTTSKQLRARPESEADHDDSSALVKEIRLLRAEKSQQELLFDKRRAQLENELSECKALYKQQQLKYQQKFDLDPMEPQRVALSTRTLQDALDEVVREKEELVMKHSRLQQLYVTLEQEHTRTTALLQAQVAEMENRRVAQATLRVRAVLEKWVFTKVSHRWKQWRLVVLSERLQAKQREEERARLEVVAAKQRSVVQERAAKLVMKLLQSTRRRCFSEWKERTQAKKTKKRQLLELQQRRELAIYRRVFGLWKTDVIQKQSLSEGLERLTKLMQRRDKTQAWRKWMLTPLRQRNARLCEQNEILNAELATMKGHETELRSLCESLETELSELKKELHQCSAASTEQLHSIMGDHEVALNRIGRVLQHRRQRLRVCQIFVSWREDMQRRRNLKHKIAVFHHHYETKKVLKSVHHWALSSHEQRRVRQITGRFLRRMRMVSAYRCFMAWREFAATRKEHAATIKRVVLHMKNQQLIKCFTTWSEFREEQQAKRRSLAAMCSILERLETSRFFTHWKTTSVALSAAAEQAKRKQIESEWKQRLEKSKQELKKLRQYFHTWQKTTKNGKRFRQLTTKCAIKWRNGIQGKYLEAWKIFVVQRTRARELLARLAVRRESSELQCAWTRWRTQTVIIAKELTLQDLERERAAQIQRLEQELDHLRLAQSALQATSVEREQVLQLELHALRDSLNSLQGECAQYKGCLKAVCVSVSQRRTTLKWLRAWQESIARSTRYRQLVESTRAKREARIVQRVFSAWNGQRRKRLKVTAMVRCILTSWHEHTLVDCYRAWAHYARKRSSVRNAARTFSHNSHHRLYLAVFIAWKDDAKKTRLLRKTLEQIWLTSVHAHMQECFTRWAELARDASVIESKAHREQVLASIQAKICGRWTACSLKAVFAAWKEGVSSQKRSQLGEQRLHRLHHLRLLAITFTEWKSLRCRVNEQQQWLKKWQSTQETNTVQAALQRWKTVVIACRQAEVASLTAAQENQERVLSAKSDEVERLSVQNEEIKTRLEALVAAQSSMELVTERLGKRACLVKWFHLWRTFVQTRTRMRLQLTRFQSRRHLRLQRIVLQGWRGIVEDSQAKDTDALLFHHSRQSKELRSALQLWRSFTQNRLHTKRVVTRFTQRRHRIQQHNLFDIWRTFTVQTQAARRVVVSLQRVTVKISVAGGFKAWKQATQSLKERAAQEEEKKRRIMMMMMARTDHTLAKCFSAWKAAGLARMDRLKLVARLFDRNRKRRLMETLRLWRLNIAHNHIQSESTHRLVWLYERQRLRLGLRHWASQVTRLRLEAIGSEREKLLLSNQCLQSELQQKFHEIDELTTENEALQYGNRRLRGEMETTVSSSETTWAAKTRESQQKLFLTRILLRQHHVPLSMGAVAAAFQQWKTHAALMSRQLAQLHRISHLLMRKRQARCFFVWRRHVAAHQRLERLIQATVTLQSRTAWNAWREYIRERSTRRRRLLVWWIEATHLLQAHGTLKKKAATVFRIWKLQARLASARESLSLASQTQLSVEKTTAQKQRQRLLTKWTWRAYSARCTDLRSAVSRWKAVLERERANALELQTETLQAAKKSTPRSANALEGTALASIAQGLQTLFRRLACVASAHELFTAISTVFPQLLRHKMSAMLSLLDPTTNELWTYGSNSQQVTRVSASLGIAGYTLSTQGHVLTLNASADHRFHPVVDQVATGGVAGSTAHGSSSISLFSSAIVAADGNSFGVLQVAYPPTDDCSVAIQIQLLARACGIFVEQILYEMVRHCRDRLQARSPEAFTKVFKQNKHWRKYFVQVEREAQKTQQQLQQILQEQDLLAQEKARLQQELDRAEADRRALKEARDNTEQHNRTQEQLMKYVSAYKKKTAKVKEGMLAKDQELRTKSEELQRVAAELSEVRRHVRMLEWQAVLSGKSGSVSPKKKKEAADDTTDEGCGTKRGGLLKGAEVATLKNELVRAESDSMLLVKAVDVATRYNGELPETLKMEVNRIALRLKRPID